MLRPRPGWLVVLCAAILTVSAWLPWLTTRTDGGRRANAIGGTAGNLVLMPRGFGAGQLIVLLASTLIVAGAMSARGLSAKLASAAALVISLLLVALAVWYHHLYVSAAVSAGYGVLIGAAGGGAGAEWAPLAALSSARRGS